eukprot:Plantae.Rhodophyta-Purpureofilum_apyrenoidigerum.ctg4672.p1 GENE.Plantae.Rhodophyta-Purpureofilum_apyrenoidigerum.ctg4672~~Plantae.Rhodophyta-Purpureofilum_apyrenoidigerum.ctg4672.p1  ORF type:complete len:377 (-),score=37.90 Plantae.Rhodophyta-Purpureofilum_apyrenoidigerum.ctg4672:117-1247(-)
MDGDAMEVKEEKIETERVADGLLERSVGPADRESPSTSGNLLSSVLYRLRNETAPRKRGTEGSTNEEGDLTDVEDTTTPLAPRLKRMRLDAGGPDELSDEEGLSPDSTTHFINELRKLMNYVLCKNELLDESASFMRDYLRTLLLKESASSERHIRASKGPFSLSIDCLPEEILKTIFGFLDGTDLARAQQVCKKWKTYGNDPQLWRRLCLEKWAALGTDDALWPFLDPWFSVVECSRWYNIYPMLCRTRPWRCRLQKTGRFICNLVVHQVRGQLLGPDDIPNTLIVARRFSLSHLDQYVRPDSVFLYFEPETENDRPGFESFIKYLVSRIRAGLAVSEPRRFIFIPPCAFTTEKLNYQGKTLLGVVQRDFPPIQT